MRKLNKYVCSICTRVNNISINSNVVGDTNSITNSIIDNICGVVGNDYVVTTYRSRKNYTIIDTFTPTTETSDIYVSFGKIGVYISNYIDTLIFFAWVILITIAMLVTHLQIALLLLTPTVALLLYRFYSHIDDIVYIRGV